MIHLFQFSLPFLAAQSSRNARVTMIYSKLIKSTFCKIWTLWNINKSLLKRGHFLKKDQKHLNPGEAGEQGEEGKPGKETRAMDSNRLVCLVWPPGKYKSPRGTVKPNMRTAVIKRQRSESEKNKPWEEGEQRQYFSFCFVLFLTTC